MQLFLDIAATLSMHIQRNTKRGASHAVQQAQAQGSDARELRSSVSDLVAMFNEQQSTPSRQATAAREERKNTSKATTDLIIETIRRTLELVTLQFFKARPHSLLQQAMHSQSTGKEGARILSALSQLSVNFNESKTMDKAKIEWCKLIASAASSPCVPEGFHEQLMAKLSSNEDRKLYFTRRWLRLVVECQHHGNTAEAKTNLDAIGAHFWHQNILILEQAITAKASTSTSTSSKSDVLRPEHLDPCTSTAETRTCSNQRAACRRSEEHALHNRKQR